MRAPTWVIWGYISQETYNDGVSRGYGRTYCWWWSRRFVARGRVGTARRACRCHRTTPKNRGSTPCQNDERSFDAAYATLGHRENASGRGAPSGRLSNRRRLFDAPLRQNPDGHRKCVRRRQAARPAFSRTGAMGATIRRRIGSAGARNRIAISPTCIQHGVRGRDTNGRQGCCDCPRPRVKRANEHSRSVPCWCRRRSQ